MSAALTVEIDEATLARLDALAAERGTTREQLVQVALVEHLSMSEPASRDFEDWQLALIDQGLDAAEKGDFAADEAVKAVFSKYRS